MGRDYSFADKTTEELLAMLRELRKKLDLIEAEVSDYRARLTAVEPELTRVHSSIQDILDKEKKVEHAPGARVFGGWFGFGYTPEVKQQLDQFKKERDKLSDEASRIAEKAKLHDDEASVREKDLQLMVFRLGGNLMRDFVEGRVNSIRKARDYASLEREHDRISKEIDSRDCVKRREARQKQEARRIAHKAFVRARIASQDGKSRRLAESVKKSLPPQTECPYCGGSLGTNPHADHIYPVSKGGQSVAANMVLVCGSCNLRKGVETLSVFIRAYNLNRAEIEQRLNALGKEF